MSAQDRAIQKLARELAGIKKEIVSWRGPQLDYSSIENSGNFTFKDSDGNVTAVVGGQDDGSNTIRHVDGPTPPIPSGLSAHVDGPIIQVSWDGSFEDADSATFDWSHLEVVAVGPNSENLRGTISDVTGASTNLAATSSGVWTVVARSVSRAEKRSLDGDAGTVDVKLVDIDGAIEAVQDSANGKNKVTYSEFAPTPADPGIFDDTWFVGQVGRPEDVVEATNLVANPSFETEVLPGYVTLNTSRSSNPMGVVSGSYCMAMTTASAPGSNWTGLDAFPVSLVPSGKWVAFGLTVAGATGAKFIDVWVDFYNGSTRVATTSDALAPISAEQSRIVRAIQVPSVAFTQVRFLVRLRNSASGGAPADGVTYTDAWQIVVADTEAKARSIVGQYFDGDTPSGESDNESHYRWSGTPHASTSEKYLPALTIGDSDNWNIIEQYRHDGTGWVKVELSHHVFSTVDLGKATVGELDGIRIMGQSIRGEQLSGDAIDGKVITGGTYRTSGGNGSWSDAGLFISQPDGTSMVRFPTDGSPLSLAASDTQIERASVGELDMVKGAVRSGGTFSLAAGVTAPPSPPELAAGWKLEAKLPRPPERSMDWRGLAYWNGLYVRGVNVLGAAGDASDRIELYNPDGTLNRSIQLDINPRHGVAVVGDVAYVMGPDKIARPGPEKNWVHGFDLNTGDRVVRWEFTRNVSNQFGVGTDGTNLVFAAVGASGPLYVTRFVPATGASAGVDLITTEWVKYTSDVQGVHISGSTLWVSHRGAVRKFTFSGSTITYTGTGWANPNKSAGGMTFADGAPLVVDSGVVYSGSSFTSYETVQACFTWANGTRETTPSPVADMQVGHRESVTISLPKRAGLQKNLYLKSSQYGGLWVKTTIPENTTSVLVDKVLAGLSAPPSTNTFPNADPATLKSTNDKFEVKGDGSGHWGNFNVDANGAMSGLIVTGQVVITPDAANVSKLATVTLPPGRFTRPPVVWVSVGTSAPHKAFAGCYQPTDTNTFNVYLNRDSTTTTGIQWYAMDGE